MKLQVQPIGLLQDVVVEAKQSVERVEQKSASDVSDPQAHNNVHDV